ncbi:hypothetical protein NLJ89_g5639 [Agrocybe chaxingu]|uniref:Uncharacterized protein n=1 Tax=Agrocybe chaxingu TaxID=84603 RepID=A0A9W8MWR8_9AGAR|nr:hypothetical protein NLJ89_g5639 [Agrocybe chaxingu]
MEGTTPSQSQFEFMPSTMRHGASAPSQQQLHAQQPRQQHHFSQEPEGVFTGDGAFMPPPPVAPTSVALANNPAYWPNSDIGTSFNAPLSTAVLPQLYSTGLVDDVSVGGHGHGHHHHSQSREYAQGPPHHGHSHSHSREYAHLDHPTNSQAALSSARGGPGGGGRYAPPPQYFDYSSYGQAAAAGFDMQEGLPPHSQPHPHQQQHQSQASQMYSMADQYGLYGNQTYNNR